MDDATLNELEELKKQVAYYEQEHKHPVKYNRLLQKQIRVLTNEIIELKQQLIAPVEEEQEDVIPVDTFECENPIGALDTFYRKSFSKGNVLKKP